MDDPYRSDRSSFSSAANLTHPSNSVSPNTPASGTPDWMWRASTLTSAPAPGLLAPGHHHHQPPYSFGHYPEPNGLLPPQTDGIPTAKIPIPRATAVKAASQRRRSARACEPCRQRKVKCDAGRPTCQKCREHGLSCTYIDIKRIRDQKQLGILSEKVERYEKLLRELERQAEASIAKRIRKDLPMFDKAQSENGEEGEEGEEGVDSDADSTTTHGSLEEIDLVKEDLNRSDKTVAMGFFGKNSEVAWMQKLEGEAARRMEQSELDGEKPQPKSVPIMSMSYHLDDLAIPFSNSADPYAVPRKELADLYFHAYMESVHPSLTVVRRTTFTAQYESFYKKKQFGAPRKWLAVLNMIFALGCRYCKLTGGVSGDRRDTDDLEFLNRARMLCLTGNVLFDHDDLQQIQVMVLVGFYLVALGQVNSASKFSSLALHSAISLGINLRFKDEKTPCASKEARTRLWWSIFTLEHLVTSITGRISGCSESLSAALLPVPFEEEDADKGNPGLAEIFRDSELQSKCLQLTLFQNEKEARSSAAWIQKCAPSPTLLFHCIVDLTIISQTVINSVYSIQGLRQSAGRLEQRLQDHSQSLDSWLKKIPVAYRFCVSPEDDSLDLPPERTEHARERISLAIHYYSARITLCRPCLSHTPTTLDKAGDSSSLASSRAMMTLTCLRASTILLSILPEQPDTAWITGMTPWWAILHYIMQAITALLIGLSTRPPEDIETSPASDNTQNDTKSKQKNIPHLDRDTMIHQAAKAFSWLHHLAFTSRAARRAFVLCERSLRRMGPSLGLDVDELPSSEQFPPLGEDIDMAGSGIGSREDSDDEMGMGMNMGSVPGWLVDPALAMVDD